LSSITFFLKGVTGQSKRHRGLLYFNVKDGLPAGYNITAAKLSLYLNRSPTDEQTMIGLHRVQNEWGEGVSDSEGGSCAAASAEVRAPPLGTVCAFLFSFAMPTWPTPLVSTIASHVPSGRHMAVPVFRIQKGLAQRGRRF
jgi:hypothetical protein